MMGNAIDLDMYGQPTGGDRHSVIVCARCIVKGYRVVGHLSIDLQTFGAKRLDSCCLTAPVGYLEFLR